jgi:RNA polymerase sigma-70 factor (ECF subfamily)
MDDDRLHELVRQRSYAEAFEGLLVRYQRKVYRLAFSLTRDRARAEELAQDVFVRVWQALPRFDGRASLSTWLYTITRNTCFSALRYDARRLMQPLDETREPVAPGCGTAGQAPVSDVWRLVEGLPEPQRRVITLFYMEDRSLREVSALLDLPEGTVKSHLHRARRALAERMKGEGVR